MSANARIVLNDIWVQWDVDGTLPLFVRHGTIVDIAAGSALERAYGLANLSPVIAPWDQRRWSDTRWDKSALSN